MAGVKTALVLINLGGPDGPAAVRPFLFNLFNDKAILRVPWPVRPLLAWAISGLRAPTAQKIYAEMGGRSPILPNTLAQAEALETELADLGAVKAFTCMRYWHPRADEVACQVRDWGAERVVLVSLYPQFSTTTTASSVEDWQRAAKAAGLAAPTRTLCCYPTEPGFIAAWAGLIRAAHDRAAAHGRPRVLFSAHGLPERIVKAGDPYQWQCEQTAAALVAALGIEGLDWKSTWQSRVGPVKWIDPDTEAEVIAAGKDGVPLVVAPIAFVSEHSETLVEIGIEYAELAKRLGVPHFESVPTVGTDPAFIGALARLVRQLVAGDAPICSQQGGRLCPAGFTGCPQAVTGAAG